VIHLGPIAAALLCGVASLVESAFERLADMFAPAHAGGAKGGVPAQGAAVSLYLTCDGGPGSRRTRKGRSRGSQARRVLAPARSKSIRIEHRLRTRCHS
jgi:hypothetical protein